MNEDRLKQYHFLFTESWRVFKTHANAKKDIDYWETCIADINEVRQKCGNTPFVREIMLAIIDELERIMKEEDIRR